MAHAKQIQELANSCKTCSEVKKNFKTLCEKYGKVEAQSIITLACEIVKNRMDANNHDCSTAKNWLKDYNHILRAVFGEFVKSTEFIAANKGRFVGSCFDFVNKYAPIRTESGRIVCKRVVFVNNVRFVRYRFVDLKRNAVFSVLSSCIESIRKNNIGTFKQIIIPTK